MNRVDRILDLLDNATQRSDEPAYPTDPGSPDACWRCLARPGEGAAGVCAECRAVLLDETYAAPENDEPTFGRFLWGARPVETFDWTSVAEVVREGGPSTLYIDGVPMRVLSWRLTTEP